MDDFDKYYLRAINFLSYRARSEKEIRDKLIEKKAPAGIIEKVISALKEQKFINDEQFARDWIRSRSLYRLKSKKIIKYELIKKGITMEIIEKALNEPYEEDEPALNDLEQAKKVVESRIGRLRGLPKKELYAKLYGFLARRGFDWETSKKAIDEVVE